jgi:SPP1 gp7 family putative phage head morphogenesis protein
MAVNANTEIYDNIVNRAAMIRLYERRVNGKVDLVLDGHRVRLDTLVKEANMSPRGLARLREAVDQELVKTYKEAFFASKQSLLSLAADQVSFAYQTLETSVGEIWRTKRPTRRVAEELVLERPLFNDMTLEQGWSGISKSERIRIEIMIRKGIASGDSPEKLALAIRKGNIHNISRNSSQGLVVTAITSVTTQADHAVYESNEKALQGWQYVAVLDSRTTPVCVHRDGHIYVIGERRYLPPAHFRCRSTTLPVFKSWEDISKLEGVAEVRRRNLERLTDKQKAFYDGQTPMKESYDTWLRRQSTVVQTRHLGDYQKVQLFNSGALTVDKFTNAEGNSIGIRQLRAMTDSGYVIPNDTRKFAAAKQKLDSMQLGASSPEDFYNNPKLKKTLVDYYILQAGELDGTLALTNYRGTLIPSKSAVKKRVLTSPPRDDQLVFNPHTGRYEDVRLYQPNPAVLENNLKRVRTSEALRKEDRDFIEDISNTLSSKMSINQRAVVVDNLRIIFTRARSDGKPWNNFKAVVQAQLKFDIMNTSDYIETQLRRNTDVLKKLLQDNYVDPVLGTVQLDDLSKNFVKNIRERNRWEDAVAPKIARELRPLISSELPLVISARLSNADLHQFYLRFAHRLALNDGPDRDQLAVALGRDLYNLANLNGSRTQWYETGLKILSSKKVEKFYKVETFGVQKRRMKSQLSGSYFGPYYDTLAYNIRVTDPRIQRYSKLSRSVDLGLRVGVIQKDNRLIFRQGFKTYFIDRGVLGLEDTRIPITSTNSFSDFPEELVDKDLVDALTWASASEYRIDEDYYDFVKKLLYFEDDKGSAKFYNDANEYRKYIASRGDAYERFKAMDWLRVSNRAFSNHAFVDHRARIYERGLIGPQAGETFRPFLNTVTSKKFDPEGFKNYEDQIGSFLGGLDDYFEGRNSSLTITGRQKIAERLRPELVKIGNHMLRGKPADIRAVLESPVASRIHGEELGKFYRFAIESAKIDTYLKGDYSRRSLERLRDYDISLALEQDASSSGAQIIALTTRNKQLAELSNVVPTTQKRRLYDEIAASTYNDPRFRKLNERLGLTEIDLRKAAKAQNMVTFYGAGEKTGILSVEGKLAKILSKDGNTLVVKASDRDIVLNDIDARIARVARFDKEGAEELKALRQNVRDIFNKGLDPGDDIMEELYFLDPKTKDLVNKMSQNYERVVTPDDFKLIARIMSEQLAEQVPILKDFTKFFGRLAEAYLLNAKPAKADFDWLSIGKTAVLGSKRKGYTLPKEASELLGIKSNEPLSEKLLKRLAFWNPKGNLRDIIYGVDSPAARRTGGKYFKVEFLDLVKLNEIEIFYANKLPKSWTTVPWVNFDGKTIEQRFTQSFEERLSYKDVNGNYVNNILQVSQKTEATWWEQVINKDGKINDIADATKARTAYAVNGNHSNDATLVKQFHLYGKATNVQTSTIHDAFFTNAADMLESRKALRKIYARSLEAESIKKTLDEMRARGLPEEIYKKFLEEAIVSGLIPVAGKSRVGGRLLTKDDILTVEEILREVPTGFRDDYGWYGVG